MPIWSYVTSNCSSSVGYSNPPLVGFIAISLTLHLLVLYGWPTSSMTPVRQDPISVSLLPPPAEPTFSQPPRQRGRIAKEAPTRRSKAPAIIAKKSSPILEERPIAAKESASQHQGQREEPPVAREAIPESTIIAERRLPTLKELLPPATRSLADLKDKSNSRPIPLGTQQPQYISYFGSIKRSIDSNWEYPQLALRYGLQGTLVVEFKILAGGQLDALRLVRSSGSVLLDEEALRAIKAAAPFAPIPPWIEEKPLLVSARMEYHDGRLNYRAAP